MEFVKYIRSQEVFDNEGQLKKQIEKDCDAVKKNLMQNEEGYSND
jgi:FAD synthase